MYSPNLHRSLVNTHIDDLRRSVAASRGRRSGMESRAARKPRRDALGIRGLVPRFAH